MRLWRWRSSRGSCGAARRGRVIPARRSVGGPLRGGRLRPRFPAPAASPSFGGYGSTAGFRRFRASGSGDRVGASAVVCGSWADWLRSRGRMADQDWPRAGVRVRIPGGVIGNTPGFGPGIPGSSPGRVGKRLASRAGSRGGGKTAEWEKPPDPPGAGQPPAFRFGRVGGAIESSSGEAAARS